MVELEIVIAELIALFWSCQDALKSPMPRFQSRHVRLGLNLNFHQAFAVFWLDKGRRWLQTNKKRLSKERK